MISNVQLNPATQVNTVSKVSDDLPVSEIGTVTTGVAEHDDSVEISNEAHTASQNSQIVKVAPMSREFMEVFSVKIWSHGLEK